MKSWFIETPSGHYTKASWDGGDQVTLYTPIGGQWVEYDTVTSFNMGTIYEVLETTYEYVMEND